MNLIKKKRVKTLQLYLSIVGTVITILLFLIAVTGVDKLFVPHEKCMRGVVYYKFALSMTVAYDLDNRTIPCNPDNY